MAAKGTLPWVLLDQGLLEEEHHFDEKSGVVLGNIGCHLVWWVCDPVKPHFATFVGLHPTNKHITSVKYFYKALHK